MSKLSVKALYKALRLIIRLHSEAAKRQAQSLKKLLASGESISSVSIGYSDLPAFQNVLKKFHVGFAVRFDYSKEAGGWNIFFKAKEADLVTQAYKECFADILRQGEKAAKAEAAVPIQEVHPKEVAAAEALQEKQRKQKTSQVLGDGKSAKIIPIAQTELGDFERVAKKHGVKFTVCKNEKKDHPGYSIFFEAPSEKAVADVCAAYAREANLKKKRPSVKAKIKEISEKSLSAPKKVLEKTKEITR